MGAAGGIWAGPPGIAVGVVVGGLLGALLADHAYVQAVGVSQAGGRPLLQRFTGLWSGVDEAGLALALVREHRMNLSFVRDVFRSLDESYHTDADDVAAEYVALVRNDRALEDALKADLALRGLLVRLLEEGWTRPATSLAKSPRCRPAHARNAGGHRPA